MRLRYISSGLVAIAQLVSARAIFESYVVHEKRTAPLRDGKPLAPNVRLPMRIAMKQNAQAMENAHHWLDSVSNPASEHYGQHWTQEDVIAAFQPSNSTVEAVADWLVEYGGISRTRLTLTGNKAWFAFDATVEEAERLLRTRYYRSEHDSSSLVHCEYYHLPKHIQDHVDHVSPGVKGVFMDFTAMRNIQKRNTRLQAGKETRVHPAPADSPKLSTCEHEVTPACIRALYNFSAPDPRVPVAASNQLGVYAWSNEHYSQVDLDLYFTNYTSAIPNGTHPTLDSVDGGQGPTSAENAGPEVDLDLEMVYPIIWPQTSILYEADTRYPEDKKAAWTLDNFFDALDSTFCTHSEFGQDGDDPNLDPTYPNADYKGHLMCGTYKPTNVISISYRYSESILNTHNYEIPEAYQQRACNEILKLGLQGVSIIAGSGDEGVGPMSRFHNQTCLGEQSAAFIPNFPPNCPWLTIVGGTMIAKGKTVCDEETAMDFQDSISPKLVALNHVSSGGGFSNIFPSPTYQSSALATFFGEYAPPYPYYHNGNFSGSSGLYNRDGRGYPDVAANGHNIPIYWQGQRMPDFSGTSASTPIFAALVNRIIEERIKIGKGPLGFLNPALYKHPYVLNDIKNGSNPGCGTTGFSSVPGWDPVTGLGTPNYPKM